MNPDTNRLEALRAATAKTVERLKQVNKQLAVEIPGEEVVLEDRVSMVDLEKSLQRISRQETKNVAIQPGKLLRADGSPVPDTCESHILLGPKNTP